MRNKRHTGLDMDSFKQVKAKPAQYQCVLCEDGGFVMGREAAEHHSKEAEHMRKAQEQKDILWGPWQESAAAWAAAPLVRWYEPDRDASRWNRTAINKWRQSEAELEIRAKEKMKEVAEWVEAVATALRSRGSGHRRK